MYQLYLQRSISIDAILFNNQVIVHSMRSGKESACQCRRCRFSPWVRNIPWRRKWQPTPVLLLGKSHGQRSLVGYSQWGHKRVRQNLVNKQQQQHRVL